MQLQKLTTREPDLSQLAVAIAALEAVLAVENPAEASEEDKVGMEVVAAVEQLVDADRGAASPTSSGRCRTPR